MEKDELVVVTAKSLILSRFWQMCDDSDNSLYRGLGNIYKGVVVSANTRTRAIGKPVTSSQLSQGDGMLEKNIERRLVAATKKMGGLCLKFVSPGNDGMPDRIVLLPDGKLGFVEVKKHGLRPRPLQLHRHKQLMALGYQAHVLDDPNQIPKILSRIGGEANADIPTAPVSGVCD
ncbi:hypothetical protein AGMMS49992_19350 [Clostridia bacterium]|nr:hypothetical protein AGMMS49992_19350 [Clostridia bacterium]